MKRLALATVLLFLCFALAVSGYYVLKNSCEALVTALEKAAAQCESGNDREAALLLSDVGRLWERKKNGFGVFLDHDSLKNLDASLTSLEKLVSGGDTDTAFEEIQKSIAELKYILNEQKISLENVL